MLKVELDAIDLRILKELQQDGRMTNVDLADAVGLSPSPCLIRVKRLEQAGYIAGYGAHLRLEKLGDTLTVFTEVTLSDHHREDFIRFEAAIREVDEILECHLVAGGFDYLLKTRVADMAAYREFIGSVIWTLPGVRETRTYAVMEEVKNTPQIPL